MQINDLMFKAFRDAGYTGSFSDMRDAWLEANGFESMREAMVAEGYTSGSLTDFMYQYFSGSIATP